MCAHAHTDNLQKQLSSCHSEDDASWCLCDTDCEALFTGCDVTQTTLKKKKKKEADDRM